MFFEDVADFVNRMVSLAQTNDELPCGGLFGLEARAAFEGYKERGVGIAAEVMAEDPKRTESIAEGPGGFGTGKALDEIGTQRLIHAVFRRARLQEEAPTLT